MVAEYVQFTDYTTMISSLENDLAKCHSTIDVAS